MELWNLSQDMGGKIRMRNITHGRPRMENRRIATTSRRSRGLVGSSRRLLCLLRQKKGVTLVKIYRKEIQRGHIEGNNVVYTSVQDVILDLIFHVYHPQPRPKSPRVTPKELEAIRDWAKFQLSDEVSLNNWDSPTRHLPNGINLPKITVRLPGKGVTELVRKTRAAILAERKREWHEKVESWQDFRRQFQEESRKIKKENRTEFRKLRKEGMLVVKIEPYSESVFQNIYPSQGGCPH